MMICYYVSSGRELFTHSSSGLWEEMKNFDDSLLRDGS